MNPLILSASDEHRAPRVPFRLRDFRRVPALVWAYRGRLALGLLFTVAFASLHTASISGAFPVFKILLEAEGLRGWVDRTVAGERLGVEFAPATEGEPVRIVRVQPGGVADRAGIRTVDGLAHPRAQSGAELLRNIASAKSAERISVGIVAPNAEAPSTTVELAPADPEWHLRLLRWAVSLIPVDTQEQKLRALAYVLVVLVITTVSSNVFRYFGEVWIAEAILRAMMDLRDRLYERTLRLPMSFFSGQATADIVTRFVQDIQEIQRGLITLFGKFIREPLRAAFLLGAALLLDWRLTLVAALCAPAAVAIFWWIGRRVKTANRKLLQAYGTMIGTLTASLQNLRVVKAYTAEDQERARLDVVDRGMFRQQLNLARLDAFVSPMMETVAVVAGSFLTVWLLSRVLHHELSISKFATLGITLSVLFDPLRKLSDVWVRIQRAVAAAERIFQILDQPVESESPSEGVELGPLRDRIEYDRVSFTYPGAGVPALREVCLTIRQGETVAIVGPNGSGKTTLVSLLLRLFEPTSGEIHYDGLDIRRARLPSLRRQIGIVTQEAIVFACTPSDNITYGALSPLEKGEGAGDQNGRVVEAARHAFADEFIRNIPGGYAANLGEQGSTLSGGQRQRLAIARAVYRDAPILIFDEATSQIDTESEQKIQAALREFAKGRTTLIIAHRLSTIQFAGRIVVMDTGRVIDQGTHTDLFTRCPLYRTLCETQFMTEPREQNS